MCSVTAMAASGPLKLEAAGGRILSSRQATGKHSSGLSRVTLPVRSGHGRSRLANEVQAIASDPKFSDGPSKKGPMLGPSETGGLLGADVASRLAGNSREDLGVAARAVASPELAERALVGSREMDRRDASAGPSGRAAAPVEEVEKLRKELLETQRKLRRSEVDLKEALVRLQDLEGNNLQAAVSDVEAEEERGQEASSRASVPGSKALRTTGKITGYPDHLKRFWFPMAFSRHVDSTTLVPIECFSEPWVIFRDKEGRPGCIRDECAHRACPLSLGTVVDGRVACPYHGWEFSTSGKCEKMPSTKCTTASVRSLPCIERDGMIWIWPSAEVPPPEEDVPEQLIPGTLPPEDYIIHAELVMELPVEHGLLVENLLDLAHAPFTHTSTFAKGWSVPNLVRFKTPADALKGHWDPYPIAMEFRPPCVVVSTIGLAKPGQLEGGQTAQECSQHLFQMHACIPSSPGKTRLLYRMGLDFASWVKHIPFINRLWTYLASQVLDEDLRLVIGQQDRMHRGANVWNHPVLYDKLGVRYRRWRDSVEAGLPPLR